jgi:hypothetical protein
MGRKSHATTNDTMIARRADLLAAKMQSTIGSQAKMTNVANGESMLSKEGEEGCWLLVVGEELLLASN